MCDKKESKLLGRVNLAMAIFAVIISLFTYCSDQSYKEKVLSNQNDNQALNERVERLDNDVKRLQITPHLTFEDDHKDEEKGEIYNLKIINKGAGKANIHSFTFFYKKQRINETIDDITRVIESKAVNVKAIRPRILKSGDVLMPGEERESLKLLKEEDSILPPLTFKENVSAIVCYSSGLNEGDQLNINYSHLSDSPYSFCKEEHKDLNLTFPDDKKQKDNANEISNSDEDISSTNN